VSDGEDRAPPALGGRLAWTALILVGLTQALSMVDRQILSILLPKIKADLHVQDAEMGLLYGTVFAFFYAVFSLPLGRLADGWVRRKLLSVAILGWSAATALAGFANGFGMLMASRLGVGIGEASVQPAGLSLLTDRFPRHQRGLISAGFAAALALGLGAASMIGGPTAEAWDKHWPAGTAPLGLHGWQAAFIVVAIPGIILSWFLWRMPEPERGASDGIVVPRDPNPFGAALATLGSVLPVTCWIGFARLRASIGIWLVNLVALVAIVAIVIFMANWTNGLRPVNPVAIAILGHGFTGNELQWGVSGLGAYVLLNWMQSLKLANPPTYAVICKSPALWCVIGVGAFQSIVNYGVMGFTPSFLITHFHQNATQVGVQFGGVSAALGIIGPLIAGPVADWTNKKIPGGRLWVTLVALGVSPFIAFAVYRAPTPEAFYIAFVPYSLILTMWTPAIYATYLDLVLPRMRGVVMSFYIISMTIVGLGFGPYTVGMVSDLNGHDLGNAILSLYWIGPLIVLLILIGIWRLPKDEASMLARARAAGEPV
jgi:MFS family permease